MNDLHDDILEKLRASLDAGISEATLEATQKKIRDIADDLYGDIDYRLRCDLQTDLVVYVSEMAEKTVKALLDGDEKNMLQYLNCTGYTGRSDSPYGTRTPATWYSVHGGFLSEPGTMEIRRKIVEQHRDLIASQRILDLEDQVKCLVIALQSKLDITRAKELIEQFTT